MKLRPPWFTRHARIRLWQRFRLSAKVVCRQWEDILNEGTIYELEPGRYAVDWFGKVFVFVNDTRPMRHRVITVRSTEKMGDRRRRLARLTWVDPS